MKFDIIGMPVNIGSGREGAQDGPRSLIEAGFVRWLAHERNTAPHIIETDVQDKQNAYDYLAVVCSRLRKEVSSSIRSGRIPLVLGGDHSLTWGSLPGVLDVYPDAYCIYIDAHGDINTPEGSPSGHIHGMHLSFLTGIAKAPEGEQHYSHPLISPDHLKFYATRALDPCEKEIARKHRLDICTADEMRDTDFGTTIKNLEDWLGNPRVKHIHLSFDIDSVDPTFAPSTGVPENGGITPGQAAGLISTIMKSGKVAAIDLVEFNPRIGDVQTTLRTWEQIVHAI